MSAQPPTENKLNLVIVTRDFPYATGETFLAPEIRALQARGVRVVIVPRGPSGPLFNQAFREFTTPGISRHLLTLAILWGALIMALCRPRRALAAVLPLRKSRTVRMLLLNLAAVPKGLWLARQCGLWGVQHIHCHWLGTTSTMAQLAARVAGLPWSFTSHRWDIPENNLLAAKMADAAFCRFISASGVAMAREVGFPDGVKPEVLHLGVDIPPAPAVDVETGRTIAFCPGFMIPVKGHGYLIEAMALLKQRGGRQELWIAGDGPLEHDLKAQVSRLGLQQTVKFLGRLPHGELLDLYRQRRIGMVVLASLDLGNHLHEGIPVSLLEGMAYGIPVIGTATGGIPELLGGGAGVLVPPANAEKLAEALDTVSSDLRLRRALVEAGRQRVLAEYEAGEVADRLLAAFQVNHLPVPGAAARSAVSPTATQSAMPPPTNTI